MPPLRSTLIALGLALAIFCAGATVGVVVDRNTRSIPSECAGGHKHTPVLLLEMFRRHLDLTDEQTRQIGEIMERTHAEVTEIVLDHHPQLVEVHDRAQQEILRVLTEDQAARYREMIANTPFDSLHHRPH